MRGSKMDVVALTTDTRTQRSPRRSSRGPRVAEQASIDRLVAAFVRIRGMDRLEGAFMTRCWLAADMKAGPEELDRLLKLLRWQGLIELPNEHLVVVTDPEAMLEIAQRAQSQCREIDHRPIRRTVPARC
ncbi:MAG: hypothetical protein KKB37_14305 [Alphaproteobacteria bacterium]|nr:hypothetical protein [Alphaproteobacteria bacterium]